MLNISICEDDKNMLGIIKEKIETLLTNHHIAHSVAGFGDPLTFWSSMQEDLPRYDIFILDWEMPGLTGQELVQRIKSNHPQPYIILLTWHKEYVYDGYEMEVFRFISKEDYEKRLCAAILDIQHRLQQCSDNYYVYNHKEKQIKLYYKDILYLEKDGKNTLIQTTLWGALPLRTSMNSLYKEFDHSIFRYVDRCYIVNIDHIKAVQKFPDSGVVLSNGVSLSISKSNVQSIVKLLNEKWSLEK